MDRLDSLRAFVAVAGRRSFAEAARVLRVSPTAISRAVGELEARLGVQLLRRTTRSVSLTDEGERFVARARRVLDDLDDAERSLTGESAAPRGRLHVTAPVVFGRMHILPVLAALLRAHPALDVRLSLSDRVAPLVEDGIDVAVRIAALPDSTLHALRLTTIRRVLAASPGYLAARGEPGTVEALRAHDLIAAEGLTPNGEWRFTKTGRPALRIAPRLLTDSVDAAIDAAMGDLGIVRALSYQVEPHVRAGRLRHVLASLDPPDVPVSLVFHAGRSKTPNLRAFVDAARARFANGGS